MIMKLYRATIESIYTKKQTIDKILSIKPCRIIELSENEIVVHSPPLSNYMKIYNLWRFSLLGAERATRWLHGIKSLQKFLL